MKKVITILSLLTISLPAFANLADEIQSLQGVADQAITNCYKAGQERTLLAQELKLARQNSKNSSVEYTRSLLDRIELLDQACIRVKN